MWDLQPSIAKNCISWLQLVEQYCIEFGALLLTWLHHDQSIDHREVLLRNGIVDDDGLRHFYRPVFNVWF